MLKGSNFSGEGNKVTDERVNKNIDFNLLLFLLLVRRLQTPKTIKIFMVQSSIYNEKQVLWNLKTEQLKIHWKDGFY